MTAIGRDLALNCSPAPLDIVCLQEVWMDRDYQTLRESMRSASPTCLPYSHRFKAGVIGAGLAVLSRYPIVEANFSIFNAVGSSYKVWHGDAYGGKGIGHVVIDTPKGLVDVFVTHTHAKYSDDQSYEEYHGVRLSQMLQLAKTIKNSSTCGLVLLLGDLNAGPDSEEIRLLMCVTGLTDAYTRALGLPHYMATSATHHTCSLENYFNEDAASCISALRNPQSEEEVFFGGRIDYVMFMYRTGMMEYSHSKVIECNRVSTANCVSVGGKNMCVVPLSDHYGIDCILQMSMDAAQVESLESGSTTVTTDQEEYALYRSRTSDAEVSPKGLLEVVSSSIRILNHGIKNARLRRAMFNKFKWILFSIPSFIGFLFLLAGVRSLVYFILMLLVSLVCFGGFVVLFIVDHGSMPGEIAALEQTRAELGVLWSRYSTEDGPLCDNGPLSGVRLSHSHSARDSVHYQTVANSYVELV